MPCNCDHLEPNSLEIEMSKVMYLIDELNGENLDSDRYNNGMHPEIYGAYLDQRQRNNLTDLLCRSLQKVDVTKYSLEMQIWWRNHQRADKERLEREIRKMRDEQDRQKALHKLTDYERKLLGL